MFQTLNEELPPMPTEMLKLRSELWEADGLHLIYNVPRPATGVERTGPYKPFPGLCIAFLTYLPEDDMRFCAKLGTGDKAYLVGWSLDKTRGTFSLTRSNGEWIGKTDPSKKTFPKGYVYIYFYFENSNTLHGWINDTYDLQANDIHPYPVGDVGSKITLGCLDLLDSKKSHYPLLSSFDPSILEIHWVLWGSSHNRKGGPSTSKVDQLFPKSADSAISFQEHDIFEMRGGTVITIRTKFTKCKDPKITGISILIGCTTCKEKKAVGYTFAPYNKPEEVYVFRVTITEKGAIIHYADGVVHQDMDYCDGTNEKCRAFLALECAKPLHILVETMGQTW